jgi:hypothetical protein
MIDGAEILNAALKRAAGVAGQSVSSLTENILREWLIGHGCLDPCTTNSAGTASIIVEDLGLIDVTRLMRRQTGLELHIR